MKTLYLLVTMMTAEPLVYADKSVCEEASAAINSANEYEAAVCIPAPRDYNSGQITLDKFFDLVIKLQDLPPKEVDIQEE